MAKKPTRRPSFPRSKRVKKADVGTQVQKYINAHATDVELSKIGDDDYLVRASKDQTYTALYPGETLPADPS